MQQETDKMQLFYEYYKQWIEVYKKGAIRDATMAKYLMTQKWVEKLASERSNQKGNHQGEIAKSKKNKVFESV